MLQTYRAIGCLQIHVPLLALNAEDDPIVTAAALPLKAAEQSSSVVLATIRKGGHVAHFEVGCWLCILNCECVSIQSKTTLCCSQGVWPKRWWVKPAFEWLEAVQQPHIVAPEMNAV